MGTSMTVPDSVRQRLAQKPSEPQNRVTANKLTLQKGKNMLDKLSKLSIEAQLDHLQLNKLKEQPETAITEQNNGLFANQDIQLKKIRFQMFETNIPIKVSHENQQDHIQKETHSIWQNLTPQTKSIFRSVDQKRKQTLKTKSCYNHAQIYPNKDQNPSCVIQPSKKDKHFSEIYSERANDLLLQINSKFDQNIPTKTIKQSKTHQQEGQRQKPTHNIVKKKILLPNVQIVNSNSLKERRKLKYIYQNQEIRIRDDQNWRAFS